MRRQDQRANSDHDYWSEIQTAARRAEAGLRGLIDLMRPDGLRYYVQTDGYASFHARFYFRKSNGNQMDGQRAKAELQYLKQALATISTIRATATNFDKGRKKTKGQQRPSMTSMASCTGFTKAWIYLTGNLPWQGQGTQSVLEQVC